MSDIDDTAVDQENIPPQESCNNLLSKNRTTDLDPECRTQFFELQNTEVKSKIVDSEEFNAQGVHFFMEKNDVALSQNEEPLAIVQQILNDVLISVTSYSSSPATENSGNHLTEDSNSLCSVPTEGDSVPAYGCDFVASELEPLQNIDLSLEDTPGETIAIEQRCPVKPQSDILISSFETNIDATKDSDRSVEASPETSELTANSPQPVYSMPTQVNLGAQKLDDKEELQSDFSSEASPAHSCKTDTMSDCLSNEKEMFDVNTNPCCQTPQSDIENNDRMMLIQMESPTVNYADSNENEMAEHHMLNGEGRKPLLERRDSTPQSGRKPLIGVASVNRRPMKSETKAILDEQMTPVQTSNQSEAGPQVAEFTEEEFRSCAEVFKDPDSFEFLQKAGSSAALQESSLSRLSLYVKFDPLVKARTPVKDQGVTQTADHQTRHINVASKIKSETIHEESFSEKEKFSCDKLIEFTPDKKDMPKATRMVSVEPLQKEQKLFTDGDMKKAMQIQDLLYRERILSKDRELQDKDKHIHTLEKKNAELHASLKTTRCLMEEVFTMLRQWQGRSEQERVGSVECNQKLLKDRDQALEDLQNVEAAFADLHRRYEKTKGILENMKQNETALREQVAEITAKLKKQEQMYEVLRNRSEEKLESANAEIETAKNACHSEMAVLGAQLKKAEMKISSLERSLEQKSQDYVELSSIYDDLIARVGQRS